MEIFNLRLISPKNRVGDFRKTVGFLRGLLEAQPGCESCHIYQEIGEEASFAIIQEWKDREALDRYFRSKEFIVILSLIDASVELPTIQIVDADRSEGLEAVTRVRSDRSAE